MQDRDGKSPDLFPDAFDGTSGLGDDLLIGAEAIARELNWKAADGTWHRRRVYHLAEKGRLPIHRVDGLGICARKSALRAFFDQLDKDCFGLTSEFNSIRR